jgi:RimJ/RimL family protein N-acetyltransferase
VISGQRVRLVPLEARHLEPTRRWANDPELALLLDRAWPVSSFEHDRWVQGLAQRDRLYLAIETSEQEHIGNIWLWDIDGRHRKAELRIVIGEPDRMSRGSGSEAIGLLAEYALTRLNLHRVYAYVLAGNARARAAFEKAGFAVEGTLRADRWTGAEYSDVLVLARLS